MLSKPSWFVNCYLLYFSMNVLEPDSSAVVGVRYMYYILLIIVKQKFQLCSMYRTVFDRNTNGQRYYRLHIFWNYFPSCCQSNFRRILFVIKLNQTYTFPIIHYSNIFVRYHKIFSKIDFPKSFLSRYQIMINSVFSTN